MDSYGSKIGDRIRVRITGAAKGSSSTGSAGTTSIAERTSGAWTHYVYTNSSSVTETDSGVNVEFDAEITRAPRSSQSITTEVKELTSSGVPVGCTHFIYLGSDCVTPLPDKEPETPEKPEPPRVPVNAINGVKDAKIRVKFTGRTAGPREENTNATTLVRETDGDRNHLLYLSSLGSTGAAVDAEDIVTVEFDAVITGQFAEEGYGTTKVKQLVSGGNAGYTHYLYLGSDFISLLPEDPAEVQAAAEETISVAEAGAALPEAVGAPETEIARTVEKGSTVAIDQYDTEIDYSLVAERIEDLELETETTYTVVRDRNGEELAQFGDEDDARQYIEDNDYNPERVIVRESEPERADVDELEMLGVLNSDCESEFGRAWANGDVMLLRQDYFDADWAKGEAADLLNVSTDDLSSWPLDLVDWGEAADQRLSNEWTEISFDSETYYGRNV